MTTDATLTGAWDAVSTLLTYPDADTSPELVGACLLLEAGADPLAQAARDFRAFVESTEATKREMVERQGSNPYTRSAQVSRYDRYKASDAGQDSTKPWQAARGARERNTNWREAALSKVRTGSAAA